MASSITPVASRTGRQIAAHSAVPPPRPEDLQKALEVCDRITNHAKPSPDKDELSKAIPVLGQAAAHFEWAAKNPHLAMPVSKMMACIHVGSLLIGTASIAYAIYVFSKKESSTSEKVMAGLGLLTIPLNIWDIMGLKRFFKEQKEQKTVSDSRPTQAYTSEEPTSTKSARA